MNVQDILKKQEQYVFPSVITYYEEPLPFERGEGQYLYGVDGRRYLDFFGGILVVSVGHCHPKVTERICQQVRTLQHTSTLYPHANMVNLAEKMAQITPGKLQKSFFSNSGTEANETAIMLAKAYTDAQEVIALRHGYSGRSALSMTLTGHASWRIGGTQILGIKHAHNAYCYRCPFNREYPDCDLECAYDVEELIRTTTSGRVAAFIAEPIQGVGGFITPPPEYFPIVVDIVRKYGGIFISDEVQTGFGRTGEKWFGIEHWGVEPDIITCAKGIANGAPMGATVATAEVADSFQGLTISTFGGNPVCCAAAQATIEVMEEENVLSNAQVVGSYLREKLEELKEKYPLVGDVRGMGLMQGVELVREQKEPAVEEILKVFEATKRRGLLIGKGGLYGNVIRITPPLNIGKADVDEAVEILEHTMAEVQVQPSRARSANVQ
ncbi:MAG: aspartate aminotransferase family protein [Anaerolineales bacterium]|nr:aspartate aminotransferase family protein [Anaerolineales bacterium]